MTKEIRNTRVYVTFCLFVLTAVVITANIIERNDDGKDTTGYEGRTEEREINGEGGENSRGQVPRSPTDRIKPDITMGEGEGQHSLDMPDSNGNPHSVLPYGVLPFMEQRERNMQARIPC